jgi:hypothetical protein
MTSEADPAETPDRKRIKVEVPSEHRLRLHRLKVLTGKNTSEAVQEAIDLYLAECAIVPGEKDPEILREALQDATGTRAPEGL